MKTRSYIRYLFHSYTHTHTGLATTRLLSRKGLNASLSLFINDGQGSRISATEIVRIAKRRMKWNEWIVACRHGVYRDGSVLKGLKYHWALRCSLFYEEIWGESAVWWISLDFCLVSILFRKFIICLLFVQGRIERVFCFILFCFEYERDVRILSRAGDFCLNIIYSNNALWSDIFENLLNFFLFLDFHRCRKIAPKVFPATTTIILSPSRTVFKKLRWKGNRGRKIISPLEDRSSRNVGFSPVQNPAGRAIKIHLSTGHYIRAILYFYSSLKGLVTPT